MASTLIGYSPERIFRTCGKGGRGKQTRKRKAQRHWRNFLQHIPLVIGKMKMCSILRWATLLIFCSRASVLLIRREPIRWSSGMRTSAKRSNPGTGGCLYYPYQCGKPFPESFCRFLEDNLQDVLQTCVFVVTKIDLIPPKQQARQLEYIRKVLEEKLSVHDPLILPYSGAAGHKWNRNRIY